MNKPASDKPTGKRSFPRPVSDLLQKTLGTAFARQGFASSELVTRWSEIAGAEIAAHAEPEKIQWPRPFAGRPPEAGTLWLRVEGPMALEIQHLSPIILERVNRFFGWRAVAALRLRQAPIRRRPSPRPAGPDPAATAAVAAGLGDIVDDKLRDALARLGAAIKPR